MSSNTIVVFRKSNICDFFGAVVLKACTKCYIAAIDNLTEPNENLINDIFDKDVIIVGGYYSRFIGKLKSQSRSLKIFYNYFESPGDEEEHEYIKAEEGYGFATYVVKNNIETLQKINVNYELFLTIAEYLDQYFYSHPSEKVLNFQAGVHSLSDTLQEIEKVALVTTSAINIEDVIKRGEECRDYSNVIIKDRLERSRKTFICRENFSVRVCLGNDYITETCIALARDCDIGMLIKYDKSNKRTELWCRTSENFSRDIRPIMNEYITNLTFDATSVSCHGYIEGLSELYKLFY
jgi:hypothetical protein